MLLYWPKVRTNYCVQEKKSPNCTYTTKLAALHYFWAKSLTGKSQIWAPPGADITWGMCVHDRGPTKVLIMITSCPLLTQWLWQCRAGSSVQTRFCCCLLHALWTSVISHPHCFSTIGTNLPSGWGSLCRTGREALCSYQWHVHLGSHQWTKTNRETMVFILAPLCFTSVAWMFGGL